MKRKFFPMSAAGAVLLPLLTGFILKGDDTFFEINRGIDIFGRVYRELAINYVDEIDPALLMEYGIEGMLSSLDPYTTFINDEEGDEVELITTGKYGGIGVTVSDRDGHITIMTVMEGYSAQRQGLLPGDRIMEVDGKKIADMKASEMRHLTRGVPGTELSLLIEREGEELPLAFVLVREEVRVHNVSYAAHIDPGIAYIRLERFSRDAADEVATAVRDLRVAGEIKGLILDLRNNPGGLLDVAVDVVGKFVPKGSLVVSTRGRRLESERKFHSESEPILGAIPIVVLINGNSASASEIVAGAIQDLDRGIILGERSFGKGLVQTVTPLVYNTQLKITTAKYYTPSGRSLQEIDYSQGDEKDTSAPRPEFTTSRGRKAYGDGGVTPDTVVALRSQGAYFQSLLRHSMFFRFAVQNYKMYPPAAHDDSLLAAFEAFVSGSDFVHAGEAEKKIEELIEALDETGAGDGLEGEIAALRERVRERGSNLVRSNASDILPAVRIELSGLSGGEKDRIAATLWADDQVAVARSLLSNAGEYERRLSYGIK